MQVGILARTGKRDTGYSMKPVNTRIQRIGNFQIMGALDTDGITSETRN